MTKILSSDKFFAKKEGDMHGKKQNQKSSLALVAWGAEVGAGYYRCIDCGQIYLNDSNRRLPTCPQFLNESHPRKQWQATPKRRRRMAS